MLRRHKTYKDYEPTINAVLAGELDILDAELSELIILPYVNNAIINLKKNEITKLRIPLECDIQMDLSNMIVLSQAIASNTSLGILELSINQSVSSSCLVLAKALEKNSTLKTLILSNNPYLNSSGIRNLLSGLTKNKSLTALIIDDETQLTCNDLIGILKATPRLVYLKMNLHKSDEFLGTCNTYPSPLEKKLALNGFYSLLIKNFTLYGFCYDKGLGIYYTNGVHEIIVNRNRKTIDKITKLRQDILNMEPSNPYPTKTALEAAFSIQMDASDFKVLYLGGFHALIDILEFENLSRLEINQFVRELKFLSQYIYIRDVVLADVASEAKFLRFCSIIAYDKRAPKLYNFMTGSLKKHATAYYENLTDEDFPDTRKAVIEETHSIYASHLQQEEQKLKDDEERFYREYDLMRKQHV